MKVEGIRMVESEKPIKEKPIKEKPELPQHPPIKTFDIKYEMMILEPKSHEELLERFCLEELPEENLEEGSKRKTKPSAIQRETESNE